MFPNPTRAAVAQPRRIALAAPSGRWPARALSGLGAAATLALTACAVGPDSVLSIDQAEFNSKPE